MTNFAHLRAPLIQPDHFKTGGYGHVISCLIHSRRVTTLRYNVFARGSGSAHVHVQLLVHVWRWVCESVFLLRPTTDHSGLVPISRGAPSVLFIMQFFFASPPLVVTGVGPRSHAFIAAPPQTQVGLDVWAWFPGATPTTNFSSTEYWQRW